MEDATRLYTIMSEKKNISQVVSEFKDRLFGFIRKRVSSTEDAEDILQDVFFQLAGNTEPVEQLSSWLFTIAKNKITDKYRRKKTELAEDLFLSDEDEEFSWEEILFTSADSPETEYMKNLFWSALQEGLNELPVEQRNAFVMHELDDIPFEEMSQQTGVPVATLISRKRYAVLHLRERLELLKNEILNY